jgi:GNAT superfamily N-acetyltransferase
MKGADLERVFALIQDTIQVCYDGVYPVEAIEFFKDYHSRDNIRKNAVLGYTVVAESSGRLLGTGTLLGANVRRVFVSPTYQHEGIGKSIEQELERRATSEALPSLDLDSSLVSKQFWESAGFVLQSDSYIPVRNGKKLLYYRMAKLLD